MTVESRRLPAGTRKRYLTLSADTELGPQPDRSAAAAPHTTDAPIAALRGPDAATEHIAAELRRIDTARRRGAHRTARVHLDRLIDYVWFSDLDEA